ncbi:MAG: glycosyltransferase family 39 protein [Chloroflexia bacterium]
MIQREHRWLLLILALSAIVRLGAAAYQGDRIEPLPGTYDQISYDALARSLLAGRGYSFPQSWWPIIPPDQPTAFWSFLYPLFLAGTYALFGPHPLAARLIQALIGGLLLPWLLYRLGKRLFGGPAGLAAAAVGALYAYFIYYAATLMTETFFILCILGSLELTLALAEKPSWKTALFLGIALGLGILLRQTLLLFLPFLLLWLLWAGRGRIRWQHVALPLLAIALLILPWTVRNYLAFGRFVLLNTNSGFAFFWANHPIYGTRFIPVLPPDGPSYQDLIPPELRSLDEAALDAALMQEALGFIRADPGRYILLSLSRIPEYFKFWPSPESGLISNIFRTGSFGLSLPFMLYGLYLSLRRPTLTLLQPATLLYLFIVIYTAIHLLSWALIRYRLPVDAVLIPFAGLALVDLWKRLPRQAKAARPA